MELENSDRKFNQNKFDFDNQINMNMNNFLNNMGENDNIGNLNNNNTNIINENMENEDLLLSDVEEQLQNQPIQQVKEQDFMDQEEEQLLSENSQKQHQQNQIDNNIYNQNKNEQQDIDILKKLEIQQTYEQLIDLYINTDKNNLENHQMVALQGKYNFCQEIYNIIKQIQEQIQNDDLNEQVYQDIEYVMQSIKDIKVSYGEKQNQLQQLLELKQQIKVIYQTLNNNIVDSENINFDNMYDSIIENISKLQFINRNILKQFQNDIESKFGILSNEKHIQQILKALNQYIWLQQAQPMLIDNNKQQLEKIEDLLDQVPKDGQEYIEEVVETLQIKQQAYTEFINYEIPQIKDNNDDIQKEIVEEANKIYQIYTKELKNYFIKEDIAIKGVKLKDFIMKCGVEQQIQQILDSRCKDVEQLLNLLDMGQKSQKNQELQEKLKEFQKVYQRYEDYEKKRFKFINLENNIQEENFSIIAEQFFQKYQKDKCMQNELVSIKGDLEIYISLIDLDQDFQKIESDLQQGKELQEKGDQIQVLEYIKLPYRTLELDGYFISYFAKQLMENQHGYKDWQQLSLIFSQIQQKWEIQGLAQISIDEFQRQFQEVEEIAKQIKQLRQDLKNQKSKQKKFDINIVWDLQGKLDDLSQNINFQNSQQFLKEQIIKYSEFEEKIQNTLQKEDGCELQELQYLQKQYGQQFQYEVKEMEKIQLKIELVNKLQKSYKQMKIDQVVRQYEETGVSIEQFNNIKIQFNQQLQELQQIKDIFMDYQQKEQQCQTLQDLIQLNVRMENLKSFVKEQEDYQKLIFQVLSKQVEIVVQNWENKEVLVGANLSLLKFLQQDYRDNSIKQQKIIQKDDNEIQVLQDKLQETVVSLESQLQRIENCQNKEEFEKIIESLELGQDKKIIGCVDIQDIVLEKQLSFDLNLPQFKPQKVNNSNNDKNILIKSKNNNQEQSKKQDENITINKNAEKNTIQDNKGEQEIDQIYLSDNENQMEVEVENNQNNINENLQDDQEQEQEYDIDNIMDDTIEQNHDCQQQDDDKPYDIENNNNNDNGDQEYNLDLNLNNSVESIEVEKEAQQKEYKLAIPQQKNNKQLSEQKIRENEKQKKDLFKLFEPTNNKQSQKNSSNSNNQKNSLYVNQVKRIEEMVGNKKFNNQQKLADIFDQIPSFSELGEDNIQNIVIEIAVNIRKQYENQEKLVFNFMMFFFALKNYPSIAEKIIDKHFDFFYLNSLCQKFYQNDKDLSSLEKKLSGAKKQNNPHHIDQQQDKGNNNNQKTDKRNQQVRFSLLKSSQNNNKIYIPKLNPVNQLMLDKHMLLKYRIFQGIVDSSILNRYKKISVTRAGKFTATKFSDDEGEEGMDDIELFKQVPTLKDNEVKGFKNYCESFIQDYKLEGFLYDPLKDFSKVQNNLEYLEKEQVIFDKSQGNDKNNGGRVNFRVYDGQVQLQKSQQKTQVELIVDNSSCQEIQQFPQYYSESMSDYVEISKDISVNSFFEYIKNIVNTKRQKEIQMMKYSKKSQNKKQKKVEQVLSGYFKAKNEKMLQNLQEFSQKLFNKQKVSVIQWNEAAKMYLVSNQFINGEFAQDMDIQYNKINCIQLYFVLVFKKKNVQNLDIIQFMEPQVIEDEMEEKIRQNINEKLKKHYNKHLTKELSKQKDKQNLQQEQEGGGNNILKELVNNKFTNQQAIQLLKQCQQNNNNNEEDVINVDGDDQDNNNINDKFQKPLGQKTVNKIFGSGKYLNNTHKFSMKKQSMMKGNQSFFNTSMQNDKFNSKFTTTKIRFKSQEQIQKLREEKQKQSGISGYLKKLKEKNNKENQSGDQQDQQDQNQNQQDFKIQKKRVVQQEEEVQMRNSARKNKQFLQEIYSRPQSTVKNDFDNNNNDDDGDNGMEIEQQQDFNDDQQDYQQQNFNDDQQDYGEQQQQFQDQSQEQEQEQGDIQDVDMFLDLEQQQQQQQQSQYGYESVEKKVIRTSEEKPSILNLLRERYQSDKKTSSKSPMVNQQQDYLEDQLQQYDDNQDDINNSPESLKYDSDNKNNNNFQQNNFRQQQQKQQESSLNSSLQQDERISAENIRFRENEQKSKQILSMLGNLGKQQQQQQQQESSVNNSVDSINDKNKKFNTKNSNKENKRNQFQNRKNNQKNKFSKHYNQKKDREDNSIGDQDETPKASKKKWGNEQLNLEEYYGDKNQQQNNKSLNSSINNSIDQSFEQLSNLSNQILQEQQNNNNNNQKGNNKNNNSKKTIRNKRQFDQQLRLNGIDSVIKTEQELLKSRENSIESVLDQLNSNNIMNNNIIKGNSKQQKQQLQKNKQNRKQQGNNNAIVADENTNPFDEILNISQQNSQNGIKNKNYNNNKKQNQQQIKQQQLEQELLEEDDDDDEGKRTSLKELIDEENRKTNNQQQQQYQNINNKKNNNSINSYASNQVMKMQKLNNGQNNPILQQDHYEYVEQQQDQYLDDQYEEDFDNQNNIAYNQQQQFQQQQQYLDDDEFEEQDFEDMNQQQQQMYMKQSVQNAFVRKQSQKKQLQQKQFQQQSQQLPQIPQRQMNLQQQQTSNQFLRNRSIKKFQNNNNMVNQQQQQFGGDQQQEMDMYYDQEEEEENELEQFQQFQQFQQLKQQQQQQKKKMMMMQQQQQQRQILQQQNPVNINPNKKSVATSQIQQLQQEINRLKQQSKQQQMVLQYQDDEEEGYEDDLEQFQFQQQQQMQQLQQQQQQQQMYPNNKQRQIQQKMPIQQFQQFQQNSNNNNQFMRNKPQQFQQQQYNNNMHFDNDDEVLISDDEGLQQQYMNSKKQSYAKQQQHQNHQQQQQFMGRKNSSNKKMFVGRGGEMETQVNSIRRKNMGKQNRKSTQKFNQLQNQIHSLRQQYHQ